MMSVLRTLVLLSVMAVMTRGDQFGMPTDDLKLSSKNLSKSGKGLKSEIAEDAMLAIMVCQNKNI